MRSPRLLAVLLLVAAICAPAALAAPVGELSYLGCYTGAASGCATTGLAGIQDLDDVAVTPDGRSVYGVSFSGNSLVRFDRDPANGALTYAGCFTKMTGCGAAADAKPGLGGAYRVAASADGRSVYVSGQTDNAVTAFARDPASGALTYVNCVTWSASGCGAGNESKAGLHTPQGLAVTPDGGAVFVTGYDSNSVAWLTRDAQTSALTYAGCWEQAAVPTCGPFNNSAVGLLGAIGVTVTADSRKVYVAAFGSKAITRFTRDPQTGQVLYDGCDTAGSGCPNGASGVASLTEPVDLALDPTGSNLYAVGQVPDHALTTFDRDGPTGALAFRGCFDAAQACGTAHDSIPQLIGLQGLAISPDGRSVYVVATNDNDLVRFDRDPRDGTLTRRDCLTRATGCGAGRDGFQDLLGALQLAVSPDGHDLYVAAGGKLLHFARVPDTPPACAPPATVSTEPSTSVRIVLGCGDANGDAFTVGFPGVPAHGALTRSADGGSVLFVPDSGYRGGDRFSIQATDVFGVAGPTATVAVTVAPSVPKITQLGLKPTAFRAARRGASIAATRRKRRRPPIGTTVGYRLDHGATATFTVTRALPGVRSGRRCVAPPRKRGARHGKLRRCTRTQTLGGFRRTSDAGAVRFHFSGRVNGRALAPGRYTLSITAKQPHGAASAVVRVRFTIVR